jgi:hypothetical protein
MPSHLLGHGTGGAQRLHSDLLDHRLGHPGRCPQTPTLVIMLFDNSGSVEGGNDPSGNRYAEAALALEKVARRCKCTAELAAVVHFDTPTSGDVAPLPINSTGHVAIARGLAPPPDGSGCSILGPSLQVALQLAHAHPRHHASLLVFSDFELFDPDIPGLLDQFAAFPGDVHAIVLRRPAPQQLVADPRVAVTPISYESQTGDVARALFAVLTARRPNRRLARSDRSRP